MKREKNFKRNFKKGFNKFFLTQNDQKKSQEKRKRRILKTERKEEDVSPVCWKKPTSF